MYISEIDLDLDLLVLPGDPGGIHPRGMGQAVQAQFSLPSPRVDTLLGCPPRSPSRVGW